ncbi:MAG: hypothetical protein FWH51_03475 [Dehalococcoidia bacterium]|nr:hypothetical protein [Dehalococcoidia bacterium]MCL2149976.1 hypothetical protein [Dehalococcoidia bacterium]
MKNKITKILGVFLTTAIVAGLFVSGTSVVAKAQDWESIITPANNGQIDASVWWVGPIERAINGDLYCAVGTGDDPTTPLYWHPDTGAGTPTQSQIDNGVPDGHALASTDPFFTDDPQWNQSPTSIGGGGGQKGWEANKVVIYKSTDFGRTWKEVGEQPFQPREKEGYYNDWMLGRNDTNSLNGLGYEGVIFDIECSSRNASQLWVTDGFDIYYSSNGGNTWRTLDNLFDETDLTEGVADGLIVSISVGYVGNTAWLYAATSTFNRTMRWNAAWSKSHGGVYALSNALGSSKWFDMEIAGQREAGDEFGARYDVWEVKVLPDYDQYDGIVVVASDYSYQWYDNSGNPTTQGRTLVSTRFGNSKWGTYYGDVTLRYDVTSAGGSVPVNARLLSATILVPSDFYDDPGVFVGIAPQGRTNYIQGDAYLCYFTGGEDVHAQPNNALDLNVSGYKGIGVGITDMDGVGNLGDASILVAGFASEDDQTPQTWATQDAGNTWTINDKRPTGGASWLYGVAFASIRVHAGFATNGLAVVGTHGTYTDKDGVDVWGGDAGLSISALPTDVCDKGFTWNTIYFISTHVTKKVDMSIADDDTIYMTTYAEVQYGEGSQTWTLQLYSAWRLMWTTDLDGEPARYWERVNSYSLYDVDIDWMTPDPDRSNDVLAHFDFVRTAPNNGWVILMDRVKHTIYYSANQGNLWNTHTRTITGATIYSVLLVGTNVMVGANDGMVYYVRRTSSTYGNWTLLSNAFTSSNSKGKVTDLRLASNQDVIAASVGTNGKVWVARSQFSTSNINYTNWANAQNTNVDVKDWAFVSPADDYASSNFVYIASDVSSGIWYRVYGSGTALDADTHDDWYMVGGAKGSFTDVAVDDVRYMSNLVTAPGAAGFEAEGNGMAYLNSSADYYTVANTTVTPAVTNTYYYSSSSKSDAVARIKGRVVAEDTRAAERIDYPASRSLEGLWAGPASVGSVILYAFGSDCNIWFYTDTLNQPITGVKINSVSLELEDCVNLCPQTFAANIQWNSLANVNYYLVIVTDGEQVVNFYDAIDDIISGNFVAANILAPKAGDVQAANVPGLSSQTTYYVSVWGIKYTPTDKKLTGNLVTMAENARGNSLSSFGDGASFTTPPTEPVVYAPAPGAVVSIRPAFQWTAVVGATSYTLTVADNPNFTNPIKTVTTTATAYGWSASDPVLEYSTVYYWRVIATTPAGNSGGTVQVFTTEGAPPPQPTLTVEAQDPPIINLNPTFTVPTQPAITPNLSITINPPPVNVTVPPVEPQPTPFYIWIIVAVGAILVIAVIILIIRTRRVV